MIIAMITGALKRWVQAVQEFTFLLVDSLRHAFTPPRYLVDTLMQMDVIGFGSLPIVLLIGFFTGGVLALQSYRTLSAFGEVGLMGKVVALSLVLELGPGADRADDGGPQQFRHCFRNRLHGGQRAG